MPADPLTEAHALITAWLDGDDSCATLQRARAWVDARRAAAVQPPAPVLATAGFHRPAASEARCPWCGATVKWWCGGGPRGRGMADCQDGRKVSRRLPGVGEPCDWPGARVVRRGDDVVPDETDLRWSALRQPTDPPPSAEVPRG